MKRLRITMTSSLLAVLLAATLSSGVLHAQNVTTWHNDIGRTGQNTNETTLTQSNVTENKFGRLCSTTLDGMVYSQPLVVTNVLFQGQTAPKTIAYVVTQNDSVYAIDTSNCTVLPNGHKQLLQAGEEAATCDDIGNMKICPVVGILGTPVIEIFNTSNPCCTTGTLYAVAESECPRCGLNSTNVFYHRLYALDITSLTERNSGVHPQICPSGCGEDATGSNFSQEHYQRPGLLFLDSTKTGGNNMVYAAFSMIDGGKNNPTGWIWAYDAHNLATAPLSYETADGAHRKRRGGIWQDGAGLMASTDANGIYHIYFSTGDGDFDLDQLQSPNTDAADSFVKLNTDLGTGPATPQPYYFTPADAYWRGCDTPPHFNDMDMGSGGTLAIPETTFSPSKQYAVKSDKENYLWVMDRTFPGGYNGGGTNLNCGSTQNCTTACANPNNNVEQLAVRSNHGPEPQSRSTPAFWGGIVPGGNDQGELYFAPPTDQLKRYPVSSSCTGGPICGPAASTSIDLAGSGMGYATTPSVSSNGTTLSTAVVWAIKKAPSGPVLYAFQADTLAGLYDTGQCHLGGKQVDQPGLPTVFSVPTIANGQVYIGTQTDFDIYGVISPPRNCQPQ